MGIVDIEKSARVRAMDKIGPQRFVYHHVPKCGGTSVARALRKRYMLSQVTVKPEESFRTFEVVTGRSDRAQMLIDVAALREQMLLYHLFDNICCISLHVAFSETAHQKFSGHYKFITVLREPVSRFISHFSGATAKPMPMPASTRILRPFWIRIARAAWGLPMSTSFQVRQWPGIWPIRS